MKGILTVIPVLTALLLGGCSKPVTSGEAVPEPTPAPTPPPAMVKSDLPPPPKPPPTPVPKVYAPEGTLYAVQRITITNDDGIFSVAGGTKLTIVRKTDKGYVVNDGRREFPVEALQVTNEIGAASAAAQFTNTERAGAGAQLPRVAVGTFTAPNAGRPDSTTRPPISKERVQSLRSKRTDLLTGISEMKDRIARSVVNSGGAVRSANLAGKGSIQTVDATLMAGWKQRVASLTDELRLVDAELAEAGQ